eukprot:PhM_4_TR15054/c0_g1_i1/m.50411
MSEPHENDGAFQDEEHYREQQPQQQQQQQRPTTNYRDVSLDAENDDWTTDSTDETDSVSSESTVSTMTSDSGSQLSEGLVVARKYRPNVQSSHGALSSSSVPGHGHGVGLYDDVDFEEYEHFDAEEHDAAWHELHDREKERLERKRQAVLRDAYKECTFKPKTHRAPKSLAAGGSQTASMMGDEDNKSAFERLTVDTQRRQKERDRRLREAANSKSRQELEEYVKHCSFKPSINADATSVHATQHSRGSPFERLYAEGTARRAQKEDLSGANRELKECSFRPEITQLARENARPKNSVFEQLYVVKPRVEEPPPERRHAPPPPGHYDEREHIWERMHGEAADRDRRLEEKRQQYLDKTRPVQARSPHTSHMHAPAQNGAGGDVYSRLYPKEHAPVSAEAARRVSLSSNHTNPQLNRASMAPPPSADVVTPTSSSNPKAVITSTTFGAPSSTSTPATTAARPSETSMPQSRVEDKSKLELLHRALNNNSSNPTAQLAPTHHHHHGGGGERETIQLTDDGNETEEDTMEF